MDDSTRTRLEEIAHYLAYKKFDAQVSSVLDLFKANDMEVLKGSSLYFRVEFMKLHNKVWQLSSVKDLKELIASTDSLVDELESCSEDSAVEMMWGSMRHKAVGQVAVGMLKEKVCISGGVASREISEPDISGLDVSEWKKCVCELFEEFDYHDEVDDDDECTQGKLNVMEYNMLRQSISAIAEDAGKKSQRKGKKNDASKVAVIYIMKHNPFKEFADEFTNFMVEAQNSALGEPELCGKDLVDQPVPMLEEAQEEEDDDDDDDDDAEQDDDSAEEPRVSAADSGADGTPLASHNMEQSSDARGKPDLLNDADYDDDDDIEDIEETEEIDEIEETCYESQMAPRGKRGKPAQATQLKKASSELRNTVATIDDPLQNALAATDEVAKSVMTGMHASSCPVQGGAASLKKGAPQKENENNGTADRASSSRAGGEYPEKKAVGILAGARPSSKADTVNFESESESPDDDAQGKRIALPTGSTQPLPKFDRKKSPEKPRIGKRKKWTAEEEQFIIDGVARYGKGKWSEIKLEYFKDSKRSAVDIKDKFRNIEKKVPK